ncbi:TPA: two pore domain potassium channel family protein [Vibrio harveyi]|nr:two pore domain potassium channel family protein [Vibrio harveyi]
MFEKVLRVVKSTYIGRKVIDLLVFITSAHPAAYALLYVVSIPVFASIYNWLPGIHLDYGCDETGIGCPQANFWTHLYYSAVTITTLGYGDITPTHGASLAFSALESVFGVVLIGLFLNALSNKHSADAQEIERNRLEKRFESVMHKIETETQETINYMSGGDSIAWLQIGMLNHATNNGTLMVNHQGKYPLYEVNARVVDLNRFQALQGQLNMQTISTTQINIDVGNLIPGLSVMNRNMQIGHPTSQDYNVFFSARNGTFTQLIRMRKVTNQWVTATKVQNMNGDIVFEQVDPNYPLTNGQVVW